MNGQSKNEQAVLASNCDVLVICGSVRCIRHAKWRGYVGLDAADSAP